VVAALAVLLELPRRGEDLVADRGPFAGANGRFLPSFFASCGLWSNVSTCDGPPCMNRKMMRLARGLWCVGRGASGPFADSASARSAIRPARAV